MSEGNGSSVDLRKIRRMLKETKRIAEHSSLTGALSDGSRALAAQYNSVVQLLEKAGDIPAGFFLVLAEDANLGEVGISAAQLAAYIDDDEPLTPPNTPNTPNGSNHSVNINIEDMHGLKDLGEIIREHLPEWMRKKEGSGEKQNVPEPAADTDPMVSFNDVESRVAEVGAKLQAVAEQLRRGDLTHEQRSDLAEQLSNLGKEQGRLARQHAVIRERETV